MYIFKAKPIWIIGRLRLDNRRSMPFKDTTRKHPMPKELQEKKFPFLSSYLLGTLVTFLKKGLFNF